jgi:putative YphP/YqiW family bacilliredoxin
VVKPDQLITVLQELTKMHDAQTTHVPFSSIIAKYGFVQKNGELVHMLERHHIEGRPAELIENLKDAFNEYC